MVRKLSLLLIFLLSLGVVGLLYWNTGRREEESTRPGREVNAPPARLSGRVSPVETIVPPEPSPTEVESAAAEPISLPPDAIADEQVLVFYDDADLRAFLDIAESEGLEVIARLSRLRAVRVRVKDDAIQRRVLARAPTPIERDPNVFVRRPPPPEPPEGVSYRPFSDSGSEWMGADADRDDWGRGVTVAVLDTAVQDDPSLWHAETIDLLDVPADKTVFLHGTAVASIIGGRDDVRGVAPGADLLAIRVMNDSGVGDAFTLARGVMDAVDRGARVLNISVGSQGDTYVLREAIDYAQRQGVVIVAAAGNDGREGILYPARYPGVLSVGAVDADGKQVYFSNRGAQLDLVAPGLGVTAAGGSGESVSFSGTSAAAPFAAGAIAGIWSDSPGLSAGEVASLLVTYADDAGSPGRDDHYGAGIVNVGRVLERDRPGVVDMALARPYVERHPVYGDELVLTLFGQNRGTELLARVVLTADVDGVPVDLTFYDVGVGEIVQHDMRLTGAGIGARSVVIRQVLTVEGSTDLTPHNNEMMSTLTVQ